LLIIIPTKIKFLRYINNYISSLTFRLYWGLGIGDWGLGIGDWAQSPIPNPQSPIPNPQFKLKWLLNNNKKI